MFFLCLPVTKLTVSAGEEKILQLPDGDHVNLFAYVVPETQPNGKDYSYEWQVVDGPVGGKKGEMVGEHSKELQLAGVRRILIMSLKLWGAFH